MKHLKLENNRRFKKRLGNNRILTYFKALLFVSVFASSYSQSSHIKKKLTDQQSLFIEAEKAIKRSDWPVFRDKVIQLKDYPLIPYLRGEYLISKWSLDKENNNLQNNIKEFIGKHSNQVVSRRMRLYWLNYLASRNLNKTFQDYYQPGFGKKIDCKNAEFKLQQSDHSKKLNNDLLNQIESLWIVGTSLPKSCDGMIKEWSQFSYPNKAQLEKRVLLAIENKQKRLAKYLTKQIVKLDPSYTPPKVLFSKTPLQELNKNQIDDPLSQQILSSALVKLAWKEPSRAIDYWQKYDDKLQFNDSQSLQLKRAIALSLSIEGKPDAKSWLESLNANTDPSVNQWLLSVAIDNQDWELIEHLARLKNKHSIEPDKWRYWRAMAVKQLGHHGAAKRLFENLSKKRSYYGFLASMELEQNAQLNSNQLIISSSEYHQLSQQAEAKRAYELYKLGRYRLARSEWNNLKSKASKSELVALAHIAHDWGWNHQSILAFAKSKEINDISKRFPLFKLSKFKSESEKQRVPLSWAYAITRQESAFKVDAISSAGARGLMQLTHNTAKQVYQNLNTNKFTKAHHHKYTRSKQLLEPETNIELGVAHLGELLKTYSGHPILATAAYNAGSHRVKQWLQDNTISDPILWIEQIPYKETREYVKNVLTYQEIYSQLTQSNDSFIANINQLLIPTGIKKPETFSAR